MVQHFFCLAVFGQQIHNPHFIEFGGGIDIAAGDHAFCQCWADATCQKAESTHAGKEAELGFRKTEACAFFRDYRIRYKSHLETTPESLSLYNRDRTEPGVAARQVSVGDLHAGVGVFSKVFTVAIADQFEVAAQTKDTRQPGTQNKIA